MLYGDFWKQPLLINIKPNILTDRFNIPEENEVGHIHIVNLLAGQVLGMLGSASEGYKVAIQNMIDTSKFVKKKINALVLE